MKISDELYVDERIYNEDYRETWIVNEKTGKEIRVAQIFKEGEKWFVWDMYQGLQQPCKNDAVSKYKLIVSVVLDDLGFLLNE